MPQAKSVQVLRRFWHTSQVKYDTDFGAARVEKYDCGAAMFMIFGNLCRYSILMRSSWQRFTCDRPIAKLAEGNRDEY
ncbi:hypothetical protein QT971_27275 [Microcoleus sp. herbarium19]|uniref:hypothetical protein n=1 Tax=unclassified Microcoleus TaxID=2642155 RepID=UPI002FCFAB01